MIKRIKERHARDLEKRFSATKNLLRRSRLLPENVRFQRIIDHHGPKNVRTMYCKALLTSMALNLVNNINEMVKMKDGTSGIVTRARRSMSTGSRSNLFDARSYTYGLHGLQQVQTTKTESKEPNYF